MFSECVSLAFFGVSLFSFPIKDGLIPPSVGCSDGIALAFSFRWESDRDYCKVLHDGGQTDVLACQDRYILGRSLFPFEAGYCISFWCFLF